MNRREVIALLGSVAVGWSHVVSAQRPTVSVIGFLGPSPSGDFLGDSVSDSWNTQRPNATMSCALDHSGCEPVRGVLRVCTSIR